jgi:serine protease inhibitor
MIGHLYFMPDWKQTTTKEVAIPKVNLMSKSSIDKLLNMETTDKRMGNSYFIAEAKQQATLKMNETGARARAAVEVALCLGIDLDPKRLVIDQPFLFTILRPGVTVPIFAAYVDYDSWSDPGNLDR